MYCLDYTSPVLIWHLVEVCLVKEWFVEGPEPAILVFHHKAKHDLVLPLELQLSLNHGLTCNFNSIPCHEEIRGRLALFNILMVSKIFE